MIDAIRLQNILAFRSIEISLSGLTLLSGTNSAGKSSLLHALALLRQSYEVKTLPEAWMLNGELVDLGTGRDLLHADPVDIDGSGGQVSMSIGIKQAATDDEWVAAYEPEADVLPMISGPTEPATSALFSPGFQYLKADRIVPAVTYPKSYEAVTVLRWLGPSGEHAPNFLRVHGGHPAPCVEARYKDAVSTGLLDQTNAWLDQLSPGTAMAVDDVPGTDFVRLTFTRSGPDVRTDPHRSTNVGFGLTYALPVIVACLTATPGCLLLIENPEAHLHPSGQAAIGRLCAMAAAGGAQVVVETHSDHVLNAIRLCIKRNEVDPESVILHFFAREAGVLQPALTSLTVGPDGMLPSWPQGFFDQWDHDLDELLG
jgi:predicted ATPase